MKLITVKPPKNASEEEFESFETIFNLWDCSINCKEIKNILLPSLDSVLITKC